MRDLILQLSKSSIYSTKPVTSVVDAFLSLYPEEKPHDEKIEEPKSDPEEIQQKRKYTRRNTE
ncbi:TPA: hypothetical protein MCV18_005091 [Klebsiella pneumoniae]|nr:hypothetical protein [Klebsiella pneumoniae]